MRILWVWICVAFGYSLFGQPIILDEEYSDWTNIIDTYEDSGDNTSLDIESLAIANDNRSLYLKILFDKEISLQNEGNITIEIKGAGYRLRYNLGQREGSLDVPGFDPIIYHNDIGLISSPTVTSREYEIKINRQWDNIADNIFIEGNIFVSVYNAVSNGDQILNNGGLITYQLKENIDAIQPIYNIAKDGDLDFRFCSYNVLRDEIFESATRPTYSRILKTIDADIYAFQEVYDHTSAQLLSRLGNVLNVLDTSSPWYHSKRGGDIILISKYPIIYAREFAGNGVFVINMDGQEMMIINIHLACCENDASRQREVDAILSFIREAKEGQENYDLKDGTPIIIAGDTNFVGEASQVAAIKNGNLFNNSSNGPDFEPDWDDDGLSDAKAFATGDNSLVTWYSPFSSYSSGRLDYIFYSDSQLEITNNYVLATKGLSAEQLDAYNLEADDTTLASDHLPVVADFNLLNRTSTSSTSVLEALQVFPYPADDFITLKIDASIISSNIKLLNIDGQKMPLLTSRNINEATIDTRALPEGLYFIIAYDQSRAIHLTQKIVIAR